MRVIAIKADSRVGGLHHEAVGRDLERRHWRIQHGPRNGFACKWEINWVRDANPPPKWLQSSLQLIKISPSRYHNFYAWKTQWYFPLLSCYTMRFLPKEKNWQISIRGRCGTTHVSVSVEIHRAEIRCVAVSSTLRPNTEKNLRFSEGLFGLLLKSH